MAVRPVVPECRAGSSLSRKCGEFGDVRFPSGAPSCQSSYKRCSGTLHRGFSPRNRVRAASETASGRGSERCPTRRAGGDMARELWDNPMGTDGFEFVEYTGPEPAELAALFERMGFVAAARHRSKNVTLFKQGDINFILNAEPESFAQAFARLHGPSVCAIAFRVKNAASAYDRAIRLGARPVHGKVGPMELNTPAIEGIGGSLIYLVDRYGEHTIYDVDFLPLTGGAGEGAFSGVGLTGIDHLTHNVHRGRMALWAEFYERLFNFREIRYFDIEGKFTGLHSKAMTSPCGKIRIPINESADDRSQIAEYLEAYRGEGIQHIALGTRDIYATVEALRARGVPFQGVPDTYYEQVESRLPAH